MKFLLFLILLFPVTMSASYEVVPEDIVISFVEKGDVFVSELTFEVEEPYLFSRTEKYNMLAPPEIKIVASPYSTSFVIPYLYLGAGEIKLLNKIDHWSFGDSKCRSCR